MSRCARIIVALVALVALASPAAAHSQPAATQELTVVEADVGFSHDPYSPHIGMFPSSGIYETLVRADENLQLQPLLATSWEYLGDFTWRFHLRQGVRFHDGQPFNAQAAAYVLNRVAKW